VAGTSGGLFVGGGVPGAGQAAELALLSAAVRAWGDWCCGCLVSAPEGPEGSDPAGKEKEPMTGVGEAGKTL
jgi:hypothetical protein